MDNKELKLAYMAGILDGDGSFSLIKRITKWPSPMYIPMIQLASNNHELIHYFSEYGGACTTRLAYIAKDGGVRKENYQWKMQGLTQCLPFLENVIPYLVVKKERAIFLRDYIQKHPFVRGSNRLSNEELYSREKSYLKMIKYNNSPNADCSLTSRVQSENILFWAYVAGIMDSDGSFSIKKENKNRKSATYTPLISISMTDCRAISYIMSNFIGANMIIVKAKTTFNGLCYRLSISSKNIAIDFLKKCLPYLLVKKNQAKQLLEFCEGFQSTNYRKNGISEKEIAFRESCYQRIIKLNKYGVVKSSLMDLELLPDDAGDNKAEL